MSEITEAEAIKDNLKLSRRILGLPQETTFEYLQRIVQKSLQNGVNIFKRIFQGQQKHQDIASQAEVQNKQNQIKATKRYDFKLFQGSPQQSTHEDNYKMQQSLKFTEKVPSLNNISGQIQFQKSSSAQKSVQSFYKSGRKRLKRDPSDSSIYKSSKKPYSQKSKQEKEFEEKISFEYFCDYRESLIEARKRQKQAPVQQQKSLKERYEQYAQKVATLNGPIDNNNPSYFSERSPRILEIRRQRQQRRNLRKKVQFEQEEHHQLYNIDKVNEVLDQQVQRRKYQRKLQQEKKIRILQERRKFEESERIRIFQQQQRKEAAIKQENRKRQQLQLARKAQQQRQIIEKQKRQKQERQKLNIDEQRQRQQALSKQSSRNQLPPFDQQPNQASNYEDSSNIASRPAELNSQQSSQIVQQQIVSKNSEQNQNAVPSLSISPSKANKVEQKETPPKQPQKNNPFKNTPQTKNLTLHDLIGTNNNNGDGVRSLPKQENASPQKSNIFKSPSGVISNLFINGQQQNSQQFPIAQPSPSIMQNQQSNLYSNNQNIGNPLFGNSFGNNQPTSMNPLISANNFNNQNQNNSMIVNNPMHFMSSRGMNNNSMGSGTPTGSNQMGLGYGSMVQSNSHPQFAVANPNPQLNQMFPPNQMGLNTPGSSGSSANSYISPQNPANPPRNFFMQTNPQNEPSLFSTTNPNQNKQSSVSKKKGTVRIS